MARRFFSGGTLEQAVMQAARHHQVEPADLAYRKLDKKHGFLKTRRAVVIEVDPDNPRRPTEAAEAAVTQGEGGEAASVAVPPSAAPPEAPSGEPSGESSGEAAAEATAAPESAPRSEAPARRPRRGRAPRADAPPPPVEAAEAPPVEAAEAPPTKPRRRAKTGSGEVGSPPVSAAGAEDTGEKAAAGGQDDLVRFADGPTPVSRRFPPATGELAEAALEGLEELFEAGRLDLEAAVFQGEDRLEIEVRGSDQERLLANDGEILLAIQHLLPRVMRGIGGRSAPCRVDSESFHEIRQEKLRSLAQEVASEVLRRGRPRILDPMSPEERRIVHLTLADDPEVVTESQGSGFFKRVSIRPAKQPPR